MQLREQFDFGRGHASHQVLGLELRRVFQTCRGQHFGQGLEGVAVELKNPLGLVRHHKRPLAQRVLGGHAGGAFVGMAGLRLNAAKGYAPQNPTIHLRVSE